MHILQRKNIAKSAVIIFYYFYRIDIDDSKLKKHDELINQIFADFLIEDSKKRAAREDRAAGSNGANGAAGGAGTTPASGEEHKLSKWLSKKAVINFVNNIKK